MVVPELTQINFKKDIYFIVLFVSYLKTRKKCQFYLINNIFDLNNNITPS